MMKNIFLIFLAAILSSCAAKKNIVSMEDYDKIPENAYVKDVNRNLDFFIGSWINIEKGNKTELSIKKKKISKKTYNLKTNYVIDVLIVKHKVTRLSDGKILQNTMGTEDRVTGEIVLESIGFGLTTDEVVFFYIGKCGVGSAPLTMKKTGNNNFQWSFNSVLTDKDIQRFHGKDVEVYLPKGNSVIFKRY